MKRLTYLAVAAAVLLFSYGASCGGGHPTPVPTPTPPPPAPSVPPKGEPHGGDRLLRNEANRYLRTNAGVRFDPFGVEACCAGWAKCPVQGWPGINACFIDETAKYGANLYHFRIGPWFARCADGNNPACGEVEWADAGGAYLEDGTWNDVFWVKVRALTWKLYQQGAYLEVVPVDDWWLKGACGKDRTCRKSVPWLQADVEAWGKRPSPMAEALIRKTVEELGCFGNVIYATGNEEDLIPGTTVDHINWRIRVIKDEQQKTGCGFDHLIGTGSDKVGIVGADYSITHNCSPIAGPIRGRLAAQNECNDGGSPEQAVSRFKLARDHGQRWDAWRNGEEDDAKWERRLELFKAVVDGDAQVECFAPNSEDPLWAPNPTVGGSKEHLWGINSAKLEVGERCGTDHAGSLATVGLLAAELRKRGYCASGPWGDALAIRAPNGLWQEFHSVSFADGCWANNAAVLPKGTWTYNGPAHVPAACTVAVPGVDQIVCKLHQATNYLMDCTPKAGGQPILPEGHPQRQVCELAAMGGASPTFFISGGLTLVPQRNPMQVSVKGIGTGTLTCKIPAQPNMLCNTQIIKTTEIE